MLGLKLSVVAASVVLAPLSTAILVAPGSPCGTSCGNVLTAITGPDVVCDEGQYSYAPAGIVFETCTNCELTSTYSSGNQTDLQSMLYNVRFAFSYCIFGQPGNPNFVDNPCLTSTACAPLQEAIQYNNFSTTGGGYDYCSNWAGYQVPKCSACLTALDNGHYLNNYLVMLDAGCQQEPAIGSTISVAGNPFSTVEMNVTTPTPTLASIPAPNYGPISLGARVGIAFGALAGILALVGFCVVMNGKRRRRAFLKDLEKKHRAQGWPGPGGHFEGGQSQGELNQTPMSQRPLRGWDESPVSAGTPLPRYFSPYSSQYNSPSDGVPNNTKWPGLAPQTLNHVSEEHLAAHGQSPPPPAFTAWPSATQEKLMQQMQLQHDQHEQRQQEMAIGIALGGTEPSLRSKNSSQQMNSDSEFERSPSKGKKRDDSYELQEVESSPNGGGSVHSRSRPQTEQQAPVLQHPGFGRKHSNSSRHGVYVHGGLTEEDARRGNAL